MSAGELPVVRPDSFASENPALQPRGQYANDSASAAVGRWLGRTKSRAESRLSLAYRRSQNASTSLLQRVRERTRQIRQEHPIPTVAVISGTAFALGLTLAILRSRRT